jgi:hypothetical protein
MAGELVQVCNLDDYDSTTKLCASPYYEPQSTVLPVLSIADASQIGLSMAVLWAVAWTIRRMKRVIDQS